MRIFRLLFLGIMCCGIFLSGGCGSDGKDVTGTLTVSNPSITNTTTVSQVSFTITYTNPFATSVGGVEVSITTSSPTIPGSATSVVYTLNNNGTNSSSFVLTFAIPRDTTIDQTFRLTATTGSLLSSATATIPAQGTTPPVVTPMSALPSSLTFAATAPVDSTQTAIISGGTGAYSVLNINPSPNPNIDATISGTTLTVKKLTSVTGGIATILIVDTATPPNSTTVTVNY